MSPVPITNTPAQDSRLYTDPAIFSEALKTFSSATAFYINPKGNLACADVLISENKPVPATEKRLVELKVIQFLGLGRRWLKTECDLELVKQVAKNAGLLMNDLESVHDHKELRLVIAMLADEILHKKPHHQDAYKELCKAFTTKHAKLLSPYEPHVNRINQAFSDFRCIEDEREKGSDKDADLSGKQKEASTDAGTGSHQDNPSSHKGEPGATSTSFSLAKLFSAKYLPDFSSSTPEAYAWRKQMVTRVALGALTALAVGTTAYFAYHYLLPANTPGASPIPLSVPSNTDASIDTVQGAAEEVVDTLTEVPQGDLSTNNLPSDETLTHESNTQILAASFLPSLDSVAYYASRGFLGGGVVAAVALFGLKFFRKSADSASTAAAFASPAPSRIGLSVSSQDQGGSVFALGSTHSTPRPRHRHITTPTSIYRTPALARNKQFGRTPVKLHFSTVKPTEAATRLAAIKLVKQYTKFNLDEARAYSQQIGAFIQSYRGALSSGYALDRSLQERLDRFCADFAKINEGIEALSSRCAMPGDEDVKASHYNSIELVFQVYRLLEVDLSRINTLLRDPNSDERVTSGELQNRIASDAQAVQLLFAQLKGAIKTALQSDDSPIDANTTRLFEDLLDEFEAAFKRCDDPIAHTDKIRNVAELVDLSATIACYRRQIETTRSAFDQAASESSLQGAAAAAARYIGPEIPLNIPRNMFEFVTAIEEADSVISDFARSRAITHNPPAAISSASALQVLGTPKKDGQIQAAAPGAIAPRTPSSAHRVRTGTPIAALNTPQGLSTPKEQTQRKLARRVQWAEEVTKDLKSKLSDAKKLSVEMGAAASAALQMMESDPSDALAELNRDYQNLVDQINALAPLIEQSMVDEVEDYTSDSIGNITHLIRKLALLNSDRLQMDQELAMLMADRFDGVPVAPPMPPPPPPPSLGVGAPKAVVSQQQGLPKDARLQRIFAPASRFLKTELPNAQELARLKKREEELGAEQKRLQAIIESECGQKETIAGGLKRLEEVALEALRMSCTRKDREQKRAEFVGVKEQELSKFDDSIRGSEGKLAAIVQEMKQISHIQAGKQIYKSSNEIAAEFQKYFQTNDLLVLLRILLKNGFKAEEAKKQVDDLIEKSLREACSPLDSVVGDIKKALENSLIVLAKAYFVVRDKSCQKEAVALTGTKIKGDFEELEKRLVKASKDYAVKASELVVPQTGQEISDLSDRIRQIIVKIKDSFLRAFAPGGQPSTGASTSDLIGILEDIHSRYEAQLKDALDKEANKKQAADVLKKAAADEIDKVVALVAGCEAKAKAASTGKDVGDYIAYYEKAKRALDDFQQAIVAVLGTAHQKAELEGNPLSSQNDFKGMSKGYATKLDEALLNPELYSSIVTDLKNIVTQINKLIDEMFKEARRLTTQRLIGAATSTVRSEEIEGEAKRFAEQFQKEMLIFGAISVKITLTAQERAMTLFQSLPSDDLRHQYFEKSAKEWTQAFTDGKDMFPAFIDVIAKRLSAISKEPADSSAGKEGVSDGAGKAGPKMDPAEMLGAVAKRRNARIEKEVVILEALAASGGLSTEQAEKLSEYKAVLGK